MGVCRALRVAHAEHKSRRQERRTRTGGSGQRAERVARGVADSDTAFDMFACDAHVGARQEHGARRQLRAARDEHSPHLTLLVS